MTIAQIHPKIQIDPASVFLVTGGARGIAARCTIALAQQFQCRWILLGRTKLEPIEPEWAKNCLDEAQLKKRIVSNLLERGQKPIPKAIAKMYRAIAANREIRSTLATLQQLGCPAEYLSVDVTDAIALQEKLAFVPERYGEISGIIHAAGNLADKRIEKKTLQDFETVYAPKVKGLANLLRCVPPSQLDYLILFSSVSSIYGNAGQTDYALANEILNKSAHLVKQIHPQCHAFVVNWGPIDGGMVTPELKKAYAERNIHVISIESATAMLVRELAAVPADTPQAVIGSPLPPPVVGLSSQLREHRIRRQLTLDANPFLYDHQIGGYPVLPFTCAMSWVASTCEQLYPGYKLFQLTDFRAFKGISFDETLASEYILEVKEISKHPSKEIDVEAQILSEAPNGKMRYHFRGKAKLLRQLPDSPIYESIDLTSDNTIRGSQEDFYQNNEGVLFHGTLFQGLQKILNTTPEKITSQCCLYAITQRQQGQFQVGAINPYIADVVMHSGGIYLQYLQDDKVLPSWNQRWEKFASVEFNETFYVSTEIMAKNKSEITANIIAHDRQGRVYFQSIGSRAIIVPSSLKWRK